MQYLAPQMLYFILEAYTLIFLVACLTKWLVLIPSFNYIRYYLAESLEEVLCKVRENETPEYMEQGLSENYLGGEK